MVNIEIDPALCTACGFCVEECPVDVLKLGEIAAENRHPERCVSCGHCAAICPVDAISSSEGNHRQPFRLSEFPEDISDDQLLFHRKRSVRNFREKALGRILITDLIKYAEKAPSSHNFRTRRYLVFDNPGEIQALGYAISNRYRKLLRILGPVTLKLISIFSKSAYKELSELVIGFKWLQEHRVTEADNVFRAAPAVICIAAPEGGSMAKDDCLAAQHYMALYGKSIGVESFICGYAQHAHKVIEKQVDLDPGWSIYAVIAFGFGKHEYKREVLFGEPVIRWATPGK